MIAVGKSCLEGDLFNGKMDVRKEQQGLFKTAFHGVVDGGDTGLLFEKMTEGADGNIEFFRNGFQLKGTVAGP